MMIAPPTLLAVEDDPTIVELLRTVVAPLNMELVAATSGSEALRQTIDAKPALITLDLVLPDMSGFTVLETLRQNRAFDDVPIVVVSAMADTQAVQRAYSLGASDFVAKPFNVDALESKLQNLARLCRALLEARDRARREEVTAESTRRALRSFAHEVRNPLAAIAAAAQLLARENADAAMRARMAKAIESEARRIGALLHDCVAEQVQAPLLDWIDVPTLVEEVLEVNLLGSEARARISFRAAPALPKLRADSGRLKQVLLNLLLNAAAATAERGTIALHALCDGKGIALHVEDTGCGIAEADLPRIFDESFTTRAGGEGLGLPIARRIVEEHGGTLRVKSRVGAGTTFTIWLPHG